MSPNPPSERPLNPPERFRLSLGSAATVLLFYLLISLSLLGLLMVIAVEAVLVLPALRIGLAGWLARHLTEDVRVLRTMVRCLWQSGGAEMRKPLTRPDAPGLFRLLDSLCGRLGVATPQTVALEMNLTAWVNLRGLRRNSGTATLGIGFDLLAGLTVAEVEAVLAHEMVHAKLIQRGLRNWLAAGVGRCVRITQALDAIAEARQQAKRSAGVVEAMLAVADWLTARAARRWAAYSRQDEFEADRGAAELCGTDSMRSALLRLEELGRIAGRLPWSERLAQLQLETGYSAWLLAELERCRAHVGRAEPEVFNPYATHPLIADRIAALPAAAARAASAPEPGVSLLADPDRTAAEVVGEIERILTLQEQRDQRELQSWLGRARRSARIQPLQWPAVVVNLGAGITLIAGLVAAASGTISPALPAGALGIVAGVWLFRLGRYRDRTALPVPDYAVLTAGTKDSKPGTDFAAAEKSIAQELDAQLAGVPRRKAQVRLLVAHAYDALAECRFLRAHVAARRCLDLESDRLEARLALAIASAAVGQTAQSHQFLFLVQQVSGFTSSSTAWGAAWTLMMGGDWTSADALLFQAMKDRPHNASLLALRALAQSRRGKMQGAVNLIRQACTPTWPNKEYGKLKADLLLVSGRIREAGELLAALAPFAEGDAEIAHCQVRYHLTRREVAEADAWLDRALRSDTPGARRVKLGEAFEAARLPDRAREFYQTALGEGFFPAAYLGLARLEADAGNVAEARRLGLDSLNLDREVGKEGATPLDLFPQAMGQLLQLRAPLEGCRAWLVSCGPNSVPKVFAGRTLCLFARSRPEAEALLAEISSAMHPGKPPALPGSLTWSDAPKRRQPQVPVRPGLQVVAS